MTLTREQIEQWLEGARDPQGHPGWHPQTNGDIQALCNLALAALEQPAEQQYRQGYDRPGDELRVELANGSVVYFGAAQPDTRDAALAEAVRACEAAIEEQGPMPREYDIGVDDCIAAIEALRARRAPDEAPREHFDMCGVRFGGVCNCPVGRRA